MKHYLLTCLSLFASLAGHAQYSWMDGAEAGKLDLSGNVSYMVEAHHTNLLPLYKQDLLQL